MIGPLDLRPGAKINLRGLTFDLRGTRLEPVTIARTTRVMLPLPAGFLPVRYEDGGVLLAHVSQMEPRS